MPRYGRPTRYRGIRFRSETEARWAVYFDALHQPWRFEPRAFALEDELYRPDFWLPAQKVWVEIKPELAFVEPKKLAYLAAETGVNVYAFLGRPAWPYDIPDGQIVRFTPHGMVYAGYRWTNCERCGVIGITFNGELGGLPHGCVAEHDHRGNTARVVTATVLSRAAKF